MEQQFKTVARGARHGVPDKEQDVVKLTAQYINSGLHTHKAGRTIKDKNNKAADFMTEGANELERLNSVRDWFSRRSHARSTEEDFEEHDGPCILPID